MNKISLKPYKITFIALASTLFMEACGSQTIGNHANETNEFSDGFDNFDNDDDDKFGEFQSNKIELQNEANQLRKNNISLEANASTDKQNIDMLAKQNEDLAKLQDEKLKNITKLEDDIKKKETELNNLKNQSQDDESTINQSKAELEKNKSELNKLQAQFDNAKLEQNEINEELKKASGELEKQQGTVSGLLLDKISLERNLRYCNNLEREYLNEFENVDKSLFIAVQKARSILELSDPKKGLEIVKFENHTLGSKDIDNLLSNKITEAKLKEILKSNLGGLEIWMRKTDKIDGKPKYKFKFCCDLNDDKEYKTENCIDEDGALSFVISYTDSEKKLQKAIVSISNFSRLANTQKKDKDEIDFKVLDVNLIKYEKDSSYSDPVKLEVI